MDTNIIIKHLALGRGTQQAKLAPLCEAWLSCHSCPLLRAILAWSSYPRNGDIID